MFIGADLVNAGYGQHREHIMTFLKCFYLNLMTLSLQRLHSRKRDTTDLLQKRFWSLVVTGWYPHNAEGKNNIIKGLRRRQRPVHIEPTSPPTVIWLESTDKPKSHLQALVLAKLATMHTPPE